ncbi:iron chelate uptake ABC transporter family permease subunit [Leucobacter luti]|uniref:Iron complex transport system permease protein n=1 Tax=Leucobacter luti TaxID=340320 RepID=A0A4V6MD01_9MICO|nr:iron chelate uptake ABC transporter family permease subunit [Leucobacter luti]MBL3698971.1 ABC transporter permease [Leucobacter luti]RZT66349.1 iron complex transport system permease protein [Leucobacter luti]
MTVTSDAAQRGRGRGAPPHPSGGPAPGSPDGAPRARRGRGPWPLLVASLVVAGLLAASLLVGVYDIGDGEFGTEMFWITRVPRTLALLLAGAAMATSGLVMQMLTQNRFVDATTSGTTEWAALGLLLTVLLVPDAGLPTRMVLASISAFVGAMIFMLILRRIAIRTMLVVPLIGIMLGAVVSALTTFLAAQFNMLQMVGTWFMGSFTAVVRGRYEVLWVVAVVTILVFLLADRITVAGLGKDVATSVGVPYNVILIAGTALVAVAAGVTTVVVGFLPFLGLVVPNIVSMVRGDNVRSNLPWVCLGGIALVVACDLIGRTIRMPFEIPVSMVLGLVGSVVFITLLLRQRRG